MNGMHWGFRKKCNIKIMQRVIKRTFLYRETCFNNTYSSLDTHIDIFNPCHMLYVIHGI